MQLYATSINYATPLTVSLGLTETGTAFGSTVFTQSTPVPPTPEEDSGVPTWLEVTAGMLLIAILVGCVMYCCLRKKNKGQNASLFTENYNDLDGLDSKLNSNLYSTGDDDI